jgi:hypothetical protein
LLSVTAGVAVLAPVTFTTTVSPPAVNGLLLASRVVTVIVVGLPAVPLGTTAVLVLGSAAPGVTDTVAVCVIAVPLMVADTTLSPTSVEAKVPVV